MIIKAHIASLEETQRGSGRQQGIFPRELFSYDPSTDTFIYPAGHALRRRHYYKKRNQYEYKVSAHLCAQCHLRGHCTRSKHGRTVKRHARQEDWDTMLTVAQSREAKKDLLYLHKR